jgi:DNA topoisomerase IB
VIAALALAVSGPAHGSHTSRKRAITRAVKETSHYLGNTPAVCRASYIDPRVFDAYQGGLVLDQSVIAEALDAERGELPTHHPAIERAVLDLIDGREHAPGVEQIAA